MKPLITLIAASTFALAATSAQALTIQNKSSKLAAVTIVNGGKHHALRIKAKSQQTAACTARCQIKYKGKMITAMNNDHVVISSSGTLQKAAMIKGAKSRSKSK
jgi:hypothetical protein